jgi:CubicO group peptidase (beta-lactamase class C family)
MGPHLAAAICAVIGVHALPAYAQSWTPAKEVLLDKAASQLVPAFIPSMAVGIAINRTPVLGKGFGFVAPGVPTSPQAVYPIGSVSKQFTAAAILSLAQESKRRFSIDDPVARLLDGTEHWGNLTVRQLLTMTSGLPSFTQAPPFGLDPAQPVAARVLLQALKAYPRLPFAEFHYSNTNYFLLSELIAILSSGVAGQPGRYTDYMRSRVFARAGMSRTGFIAQDPAGTVPAAPLAVTPLFFHPEWPRGAGDIASSVVDMLKWNRALLAGDIIGAAALSEMFGPAIRTNRPNVSYGMGWYVARTPQMDEFFHPGAVAGYGAFNVIARRRSDGATASVVILANAERVPALEQLGRQTVALALE